MTQESGDVRELQEVLEFDKRLAERANVYDSNAARINYQFHKKWLSKFKTVALVTYFFIVPFL